MVTLACDPSIQEEVVTAEIKASRATYKCAASLSALIRPCLKKIFLDTIKVIISGKPQTLLSIKMEEE